MAYNVTLKDKNGEIQYPTTLEGYVIMSDGRTLQQNIQDTKDLVDGKADETAIIANDATTITTAITESNYAKASVYNCTSAVTSLTISRIDALPYEVAFIVNTGNVTNFLNVPSGTKVMGEANIESNKHYCISIYCGVVAVSEITIK